MMFTPGSNRSENDQSAENRKILPQHMKGRIQGAYRDASLVKPNFIGNAGANDGTRTRDHRYHKPALYQLSYIRHTAMPDVKKCGAGV
ncbi:hypothetical protein AA0323_0882 [Asaia siamensis NRIC 0323]|nr:hypothetical protein AA0323_0882 [Asaia siamensis NRIC 0323]